MTIYSGKILNNQIKSERNSGRTTALIVFAMGVILSFFALLFCIIAIINLKG